MTFHGHEMWWTRAASPVFGRMWYCDDCRLWGFNKITHVSLGTGFGDGEFGGELGHWPIDDRD